MPKILDAGTVQLTNAEVLNWTRATRERYKREDEQDKASGLKRQARPANIMRSLNKHERELADPKYPYLKNPSVYADDRAAMKHLENFDNQVTDTVIAPLNDKYAGRLDVSREELERQLAREQESKCLSKTEMLMMLNHAPTDVQIVRNMVEDCDKRFNDGELQSIVDACAVHFRKDEAHGRKEGNS